MHILKRTSCFIKRFRCTDKQITAYVKNAEQYNVGEKVDVSIDLSQGVKAIVYGYLLPLILMVTTIIISHLLQTSDIISGISGIIILIPYYFGLFLAKSKIKLNSRFIISKKDAVKHG